MSKISENSTFLRYHEIFRQNPSSVVFAPLAEMLIIHGCYEEAITVCKKGLDQNPQLVSGRIALAKGYVGVSNLRRAREEAETVLKIFPGHPEALKIVERCEGRLRSKEGHSLEPSEPSPEQAVHWNTVTMADIFAAQGNVAKAREIYMAILERDPDNFKARRGLENLSGMNGGGGGGPE